MIDHRPSALPAGVTLRQLRAFVAVAQEGSITRAAQRVHLTPSALSMLISALEGELAVRLFDRTTRKIVLSEAGEELLPPIRRVFESMDKAFDGLRQFVGRRAHRFAIAASPLLAANLVPNLLASFKERFPAITVDLFDLPVEDIAQAVRSGQADFGVCTADLHAQDLLSTVLYQDRLMLACPAGHPLADCREVRWTSLCNEPLVLLRATSGLRALVEQGFSLIGETVAAAYEVAQVTTAIGLVQAGLGISILPSFAMSNALSARVVARPLVEPVIARDVVALTMPDKSLPASCEDFLAHFRHEVGLTLAS
jgi:LysR family transcriptional regulator, carnitine catabolism transcriptional activator